MGTFDTVEECIKVYLDSRKKYIVELVDKYENMPINVKEIILNAT